MSHKRFIELGNKVLITNAEQIRLTKYIGTTGVVESLRLAYVPTSAVVILEDGTEACFYLKNLELVPPDDSPFHRGDSVRIVRGFKKTRHHICKQHLVKNLGEVVGYDYRDSAYHVECGPLGRGWFPVYCLEPIDYQGETFFYPSQLVILDGKEYVVQKIRKSNSNLGQILYIAGRWVPSSSVERVELPS